MLLICVIDKNRLSNNLSCYLDLRTQERNIDFLQIGKKLIMIIARALFLLAYYFFQLLNRLFTYFANKLKPHLLTAQEFLYKRACTIFDITL
ncbi:hypothetical protein CRYO30217_01719 [Parvicella tangerina]|uniref:Uncharacterized protein n=1 Tax=Parvicella tangerina TaxID=2829795 RepID=A0A916NH10_9FLAO|nr:hypothetical protein CRYO30217_01719 [Parvicella tangerina]